MVHRVQDKRSGGERGEVPPLGGELVERSFTAISAMSTNGYNFSTSPKGDMRSQAGFLALCNHD
jgi:hypothetical protein